VKEFLCLTGYTIEDPSSWSFLGMPDISTNIPKGIEGLLENRIRTISNIITPNRAKSYTSPDHTAEALNLLNRLNKARSESRTHLKQMRQKISSSTKQEVPNWLEPPPDLAGFFESMANDTPQAYSGTHTALSLSALQPSAHPDNFPHSLSIADARALYGKIIRGENFSNTFQSMTNMVVILWAPTTKQEFNFFLNGIKEARKEATNICFKFVLPYNHVPANQKYHKEFFNHQFLDKAWSSIITDISYLNAPTRIVTSSSIAPLHTIKSIAIFTAKTIIPTNEIESRRTEQDIIWKGKLWEINERPAIVIDFHELDLQKVEYELDSLTIPNLVTWTSPKNSKGSNSENRRQSISGIFNLDTTPIHLQAAIDILKLNQHLKNTIIGTSLLYNDDNAMHAEINSPSAINHPQIKPLLKQAILISPSRALIITTSSPEQWGNAMVAAARTSSLTSIRRLKLRGELGDFARPYDLPNTMKRRAILEDRLRNPDKYSEDPNGTTTISCDTTDILLSNEEEAYLKTRVCTTLNIQENSLATVSGTADSLPPSSKSATFRVLLSRLGLWTGKVEITYPDDEFHALVHRHLHGRQLRLGSRLLGCETTHSFKEFTISDFTHDRSETRTTQSGTPTQKAACYAALRGNRCDNTPCPICDGPGGRLSL